MIHIGQTVKAFGESYLIIKVISQEQFVAKDSTGNLVDLFSDDLD